MFLTEIKAHCSQRIDDISKYLSMNNIEQYDLIFNSSSHSRGTAILIKKSHNAKILKILKSPDENILACSVEIFESFFTFVCIYAPCNADNVFFDSLKYYVNECGNDLCIIGGDFNATPSPLPPAFNIDLEFHSSSCNQTGSNFISKWMSENEYVDPYRYIWGDKKAFSYERKFPGYFSRCRIDFFLISCKLANYIIDSEYINTPRLFDHYLFLFKLNNVSHSKTTTPRIDPWIFNSAEFNRQCALEVVNFVKENYSDPPPCILDCTQSLNNLNFQIIQLDKYLSCEFDLMLLDIKNHKIEIFYETYNSTKDYLSKWTSKDTFSPSLHLLTLVNNLKKI